MPHRESRRNQSPERVRYFLRNARMSARAGHRFLTDDRLARDQRPQPAPEIRTNAPATTRAASAHARATDLTLFTEMDSKWSDIWKMKLT